jgi:hypothetical protein
MSWFKHKPRPKNPPKLHPYHTSPIAEKILQETKIEVTRTGSHSSPLKKKKNER